MAAAGADSVDRLPAEAAMPQDHGLVQSTVEEPGTTVTATFREDLGHVSVVELAGDYSREAEGQANTMARAAVSEAFLAEHEDAYDFLVVFTRFPVDLGTARGFHWLVRNDVEGIGLPLYDQSEAFGSAGRLRGISDLGRLAELGSEPGTQELELTLTILIHELFHQWGAYVQYDDEGVPSTSLLGKDDSHWSFLLDTGASVLYGNRWRDNQDGTFTSTAVERILSPLDLYLAGLVSAEEVPPLSLLINSAIDRERLPELGAVVSASTENIEIEDVIAAEGDRVPSAEDSPHEFQAAFLYLVRPGEPVSADELAALERIREGLLLRFTAATGARAALEVHSSAGTGGGGGPGTTGGGDPRVVPASVADALTWLRARQESDGSWEDRPATGVRDTSTALQALVRLDSTFGGDERSDAVSWLESQVPASTDHLARLIAALVAEGRPAVEASNTLASRQNADGGWGLFPGLGSDPLDSALALASLALASPDAPATIEAGKQFLLEHQNQGGGWGPVPGGASSIRTTTAALRSLAAAGETAALDPGLQWLLTRENGDGGFGDSPSTAHHTAEVVETLAAVRRLDLLPLSGASAREYLEARQDAAGSWEGSVFTTSLAAEALQRLSHANWRLLPETTVEPEHPLDGEVLHMGVGIENDGTLPTPAGLIQLFDGDPATGDLLDGLTLQPLEPGETLSLELAWDTTSAAGSHQLVVVVDPLDEVAELSESDNRVDRPVEVEAAPAGVELTVRSDELVVSPSLPDRLPTQILVQGVVRNLGETGVTAVAVALSVGDPIEPFEQQVTLVDVPARSSAPVSFLFDLERAGTTEVRVLADPDDAIAEINEDDNLGVASVATVPSFDLEVLDSDLALIDGPAHLGEDVVFQVGLHNRGTSDSPSTEVALTISDGTATVSLPSLQIQLAAGESVQRTVAWRVDRTGSIVLTAAIDPENLLPEVDEANNSAALAFEATALLEPNLVVSSNDLTAAPDPALEGSPTTLSVPVRNTGGTAAGPFSVDVYDGAPEEGGLLLGSVLIASLDAGATAPVELSWPEVPAGDRLVHVIVDPQGAVEEADETDNRAFRLLEVLALPDAAIGPASLHFEPELPSPGQTVTLTVLVTNSGQQAVHDLVVRAWDGEPGAGTQIGGDQVIAVLEGEATGEATFTWNLAQGPTARTISVAVDPDGLVHESDETNNEAQALLGAQGEDAFVSERYFSPDGDGVQDETTLFFSLDAATDVEVRVVDRVRERSVRTFTGPELEQVQTGEVTWNGRDDDGRLVRDAEYELRVVDLAGIVLRTASTTVDTDRSSLLLAVGTPYEYRTNLTCEIEAGLNDLEIPPTEDYAYLALAQSENPSYPDAIYRRSLPSGTFTPIIPSSWLAGRQPSRLAVSRDGRRIAFTLSLSPGTELWVAAADGSGLLEIPLDFNPLDPEGSFGSPEVMSFGRAGDSLVVASSSGFVAEYSLDAPGEPIRWWEIDAYAQPADVSPEGRRVAIADAATGDVVVLDLQTGSVQTVLAQSGDEPPAYPLWSPDGNELAIASTELGGVFLFDTEGGNSRSIELPRQRPMLPYELAFFVPRWRGDGSEILVTSIDGNNLCHTVDLIDVTDLSFLNVFSGCVDGIAAPGTEGFLDSAMPEGEMIWDPNDRSVIEAHSRFWNYDHDPTAVFLDEGFREEPFIPGWTKSAFHFTTHGHYLVFWSDLVAEQSPPACQGSNDWWSVISLENLTADLRVRVPPSGGYLLEGTSIDLHFDRYELEWRRVDGVDAWHPVAPAVETQVLDDYLGTWIAPGPGTFQLRLTAFDRAGNQLSRVRQVSSSTTPDITDVTVTPGLVSPNGDGILDAVTIAYRVLRPVVFDIVIFDEDDQPVRTFHRSHPLAGETASLTWDGRDDAGLRVPDGSYRVLVQVYDFFTAVDATPPQVSEPSMAPILLAPPAGGDRARLQLHVQSGAADEHLTELVLQRGEGALPSAWSNVPTICDGEENTVGCEAWVPVEGFVGFSFRSVADDAAGNRTIVAAPLAPEALRITGFGRHRIDPGTGVLEPLTPTHEQGSFAFEHGAVRFSATEAIREDLQSVSIQYRPQGEQIWTDVPAPEFRDPATGENVPWIPQPRFEVLWGLEELVPGGTWDLRLEAIDAAGGEHLSQQLSLRTDGLLFHGRLMPETVPPELADILLELVAESGADPARDLLLWAEEWVAAPLERATLYVSSEDDPRYETVRTFEPAAAADGVLLYALSEWKACATYSARVEVSVAGTPSTPPRTLVSQTKSVTLPCLDLTFEIEPVVSAGCGSGPDADRTVTLRPRSLDGSQLQLLSLFGPGEDGEEQLLYTVNQPSSDQDYEYPLDLEAIPEGSFSIRARLTNILGEEVAGIPRAANPSVLETGRLIVDRSPPAALVTFPQSGQAVCPDSPTVPGALDIQGEVLDDRGASYALEWGLGAAPVEWQRPQDPLGSLFHDLGGSLGPTGGLYSKNTSDVLVKELSTAPFQGVLGRLGGVDGELSVRLRAADSGGSLVCSEPVTFVLDARLVGASVETSQYLLSPNGDGVLDTVTVTVAAAEPSVLDLRVFPGVMTEAGPVITGPLVRTLASGLALESSAPFVWDGHDEGGSVVEDGTYLAMAQWVDGCGNADVRFAQVEVDNTPPDIAITSPTPTTPLPLLVTVWGTVDDHRLSTWSLSWGEGPDPEGWFPLESGLVPIPTPEPLAVWNTFGLSGVHTLRLIGDDEAGNRAETRVTVDIQDHAGLVTELTADPSLFSPNGDGRREDVAIHFGLQAPCSVDLTVVDSDDQVVALVLDDAELPEGSHQAAWDGGGAADGLYRMRLDARLTAEPTVVQTEEVPVTLDRTAPTVLIERPQDGGWIDGSGNLLGTIADAHMESWSIRIAGPQSGSPWQEIAAGDSSLVDAVLGALPGVEEGDYSLEIVAEDRAEIRTEVTLGFGVDDTPPLAELTAPPDGILVGAPSSPVSVEGSATDDHLDAWLLELGDGAEPDDWTLLLSANEAASGELLSWDTSALSDGPRTLRLRVVDRATNESTALVGVEVDNTPPVAAISLPAESSFVTAALDVVGSASDLHLEGYVLEALLPDGSLVGTIAEGAETVTDGTLGRWTDLPLDGPHLLRLTVRDRVGHVTSAETSVEVDTHPPAPPTGLAADPVGSDEVDLVWNANTEPDLVGYRVYRDGTPLFADPIPGTAWLDTGLPPGAYEYTVTALDRAGLESDPSEPAGTTLDVTPPTAEIHAPVTGDVVAGLVDVRGTAWSIDDFARYRLTVTPEAGGAPVLLEDSTVPVQASLLGQWDTSGLTEGASYTITLEAEDLVGNRATTQVTVTVDNEAPAAPTNLVAAVDGSDVHLGWDANAEPDLLGSLLYRGDDLVNAEGPILGDLRPYALIETGYDDLSRPDGEYTYVVYALDAAGNLSPPSNSASAVVETGPPHALVVQPVDGDSFEAPAYVLATVDAFDVAAVQLQYRDATAGSWMDLGPAVTAPPYDGLLDPLATTPPLVHGDYLLRAVATDDSDNTDPDPATITVTYADLTAPQVPTGLAAAVTGGTASLSWDPLDEPDLDGYLVYRTDGEGAEAQVTASPLPGTTLQDTELADDQYSYTVTAVDVNGNESPRAPSVAARVYTPSVAQPLTPRLATTVTISGDGPPSGAEVSGEQLTESGPLPLPPVSVDLDGRFSIVDLPLPLGRNEIRLRATDPAGNVSKDAFVPLDVATPPSAPTGLAASADGLDVDLSWNPNPEPDLLGYRPHREGEPLLPDVLADDLAATSSEGAADEAVDGDPETSWWVNDPTEGKWLEISWPGERIVTSCTLVWVSFGEDVYSADSFELLAWSGEVWVSLFEIEGNTAAVNEIALDQPYRTDRLRVVFGVSDFAGLSEASIEQRPTVATTAYLDQPGDGVHHYAVTAVSSFAFEGLPSDTVEVAVGDVEPPSPVALAATVLGSDVELEWTESSSPDVVAYEIARDGETIAVHSDLTQLLYLDSGRPNGTYRYVVRALDAAGNRSVDSNEAVAAVAVELLGPPRNLQATALPAGRRVLLEWDPPNGDPPAAYRVLRSPTPGGPYALSPTPRDDSRTSTSRTASRTTGWWRPSIRSETRARRRTRPLQPLPTRRRPRHRSSTIPPSAAC
ncbi:MAG: CARDB domain-containing protein [Thermoanaerobaculia bacterium]